MRPTSFAPFMLTLALVGCGGGGGEGTKKPSTPTPTGPIVYVMTNEASLNRIAAFRYSSGFTAIGTYASGGRGTGTTETPGSGTIDGVDPLGSQGSLVLNETKTLLFAVNAGSNSISTFRVASDGTLKLADTKSVTGTNPVSIAVRGAQAYVANVGAGTGGAPLPSINAFTVGSDGSLAAGATTNFATATSRPRAIIFSPDGTRLFATATSTILYSYPVQAGGTLGAPVSLTSRGRLLGVAASSSYLLGVGEIDASPINRYAVLNRLNASGASAFLGDATGNDLRASTRATVSPLGNFFFVSNTANGTLAEYGVSNDSLTLLNDSLLGGLGQVSPTDLAFNGSGDVLFVLFSGSGSVGAYSIGSGGSFVTPTGAASIALSLPTTAQGLAVK